MRENKQQKWIDENPISWKLIQLTVKAITDVVSIALTLYIFKDVFRYILGW